MSYTQSLARDNYESIVNDCGVCCTILYLSDSEIIDNNNDVIVVAVCLHLVALISPWGAYVITYTFFMHVFSLCMCACSIYLIDVIERLFGRRR